MGPLHGIRIIELAGIGPAPFACMLLADMGAEVIRVERHSSENSNPADVMARGRKSIALNLKSPEGVEILLELTEGASILIEGFRPGVMEKMGLGPEQCLQRNPQLIYGRMTGWGQHGQLAKTAGHDINYMAITGALDAIGTQESGPIPPLNLVGDIGGGALYLVMGVLAALYERQSSNRGQVVDAAISDGVISMMSMMQGFTAMGIWNMERENNMLDGGAHFYGSYACKDGKWVAIGAIEFKFFRELMQKLDIDITHMSDADQMDNKQWPQLKAKIAARISGENQQHWQDLFEGTDACLTPILNLQESAGHPHNQDRQAYIERDGIVQSAPAPRFSLTPSVVKHSPVAQGKDTSAIMQGLGYSATKIDDLKKSGALT